MVEYAGKTVTIKETNGRYYRYHKGKYTGRISRKKAERSIRALNTQEPYWFYAKYSNGQTIAIRLKYDKRSTEQDKIDHALDRIHEEWGQDSILFVSTSVGSTQPYADYQYNEDLDPF